MDWKQHKCFFKLFISSAILTTVIIFSLFPIICRILGEPSMAVITTLRYLYIEFYRLVYLIQFVLACFVVQSRFSCFNGLISSEEFTLKSKNVVALGQLYHKLCDSIDILNDTFTFHFIPIFSNGLVTKSRLS